MICAYDPSETGVPSHMGRGALAPSTCHVTEDLNGAFELIMEHPIDAAGKWSKVTETAFIKSPTHRGAQMFRVYAKSVNTKTKRLSVSARHKFYDLERNFLLDVRPTVKDGQEAGNIILAGCASPHPFSFASDITGVSSAYYIRQNPVAALIGNIDQSYINRWGGEILRNNNNISINTRIGADSGVRIAYSKQLAGLNMTVNMTSVYTRIIPTALNAEGAVMLTDAIHYDSPLIDSYPYPMYGTFDTGIRVGQEIDGVIEYPDEASAKIAMAAKAQAMFDAGCDVPTATLAVDFVQWQDTEEYKQFAALYTVQLGDDVTVYHKDLGVDVKMRAIQIKWDCIKNRAVQIVLGTKAVSITKSVVSMGVDLSALKMNTAASVMQGMRYNGVQITNGDGFVTQAVVSGKTITIKQNSYDGLAVYDGAIYKGGVAVVNGEVVMVSGMLTNNITGNCYAVIGSTAQGDGVLIYNKNGSTTVPSAAIVADSTGVIFIKSKNNISLSLSPYGSRMYDPNGYYAVVADSECTELRFNASDRRLGVDSDGFYKFSSGVKTYF